MADTKLRFSGEDNVSPILSKLKRESEELGRGLIRDARAYTTSGKETLSYIEQQIKAIERRSQAEKQAAMFELKSKQQRGEITPQQYKSQSTAISLASNTDAQQITILKEIVETIKNTSKKEIIESRKDIEKQISHSDTVDKLAPKGDEFKLLKETLQREELGRIKQDERDEKDRFSGLRNAGERVNQAGGMVAGSQNQFYLAATLVSMIPFIGQAAGSLMERALSTAERYQTARGGVYSLSGGRVGYQGSGMQSIGLTKGEFLEQEKSVIYARGKYSGSAKATRDILYLEKGSGIDKSLLIEQEKLTRGGGSGSLNSTQLLVKSLQSIGAVKGQETAQVNEYLQILVGIQQEQLKLTGETSNAVSTNIVAGIANLDESFKNPDYLKNILPTIMGGMRQASTPQAEALQYRALSNLAPGSSLLDLQEMKENPTLESIRGYLTQLQQVSLGNEDVFAVNIRGAFSGLSTKQARQIASGFGRTGLNLSDYSEELGIVDYKGRASRATGLIDAASADWAQTFETVGDNVTTAIQKIIDENGGWLKDILDALKGIWHTIDRSRTAKYGGRATRDPKTGKIIIIKDKQPANTDE